MTDEHKALWREMADHTKKVCMAPPSGDFLTDRANGACMRPGSCCSPEYCEMALDIAEEQGEPLERTTHPTLPLMGPSGCVAPPHVRPLCTLHVCCISSVGFKPNDEEWTEKYFKIRRRIDIGE